MSRDDASPPNGTSFYARDRRAVLSAFATFIASVAFGVGAWAHAKLWDTNTRLTIVETQQHNDGMRQDAGEARMQRMESKLDLILERLPR